MNFSQRGWLANQPTDWLIWMAGWLTDWLTDLNRVTYWLTDLASQIDGLANSLTEKLTDILRGFGWLNYWPTDRQTEWPAGWLTDLLLTRGLTDQLPGNCLTELMELSWRVDPFFRNFSGWTEPIDWVLDRNFRKFWLNGSRPVSVSLTIVLIFCIHFLDWTITLFQTKNSTCKRITSKIRKGICLFLLLFWLVLYCFILIYLKEVRKRFKDLDLCLLKLKKEKTHSQVVLSVAAKCFYV